MEEGRKFRVLAYGFFGTAVAIFLLAVAAFVVVTCSGEAVAAGLGTVLGWAFDLAAVLLGVWVFKTILRSLSAMRFLAEIAKEEGVVEKKKLRRGWVSLRTLWKGTLAAGGLVILVKVVSVAHPLVLATKLLRAVVYVPTAILLISTVTFSIEMVLATIGKEEEE